MALVPRAYSTRSLVEGDKILGPVDPELVLPLTLQIKPAGDSLAEDAWVRVNNPVRERVFLSRSEFAERHGAKASDISEVNKFASQYGLQIVRDRLAERLTVSPLANRTVELRGRAADIGRALGIELLRVRNADSSIYYTHLGPFSIDDQFQGVISNVLGLHNRAQGQPHARRLVQLGGTSAAGVTSYTALEVGQLYGFPTSVNGEGQTIAILEFAGGFTRHDLHRYFRRLGLPMPDIKAIGVAPRYNAPTGNPNGPDAEVMMDIEVAGAIANGSKIVVYFAPNTTRGWLRGINAAVNDNINNPTILSISWGGAENTWSIQDMMSVSEALQAAATMGISVFTAAGDSGSTDGVTGSQLHVDFPASSPWATGCGGTNLVGLGSTIHSEIVWNDGATGGATGGGISNVFSLPLYQSGIPLLAGPSMRGVPDVAGCADPNTGYEVFIDGVNSVWGGTSAVAPLWAGLFALLNQGLGHSIGFANPLLYSVPLRGSRALRDILHGSNDATGLTGKYAATPGWDACTGLGSPNGEAILNTL
jgi:kumamolisin